MLYQVLPGACLGPQARFRRPAPSTLALGPGEATKKREVAGPSPLLARSPPSEQEEPDRSLPTFQAGPAEQMPLLPVAFSLQWQARPVGSLPRGVPGPSKKPGAGEGRGRRGRAPHARPGPPLRGEDDEGTQRPGHKERSLLTLLRMTLETRERFRV